MKLKGVHPLEKQKESTYLPQSVDNLSQALFVINRHAKTATDPKFLYRLKHEAIKKMLKEGKAKKIGLHFSKNPKYSQQQSALLISCGDYLFHIPPTKEDFQTLPHLGKLDSTTRNPKTNISLKDAKKLIQSYTGIYQNDVQQKRYRPKYVKPVFKRLGE